MRLHFQERPWDLYVAIGYTVFLAGILLASGTGNLVAILLILFIPGYVLVAALFPTNKELDGIERVALSVGLSIAVVPLLGLLLNFTPFGIRLGPIVATIALFTVLVGLAAYGRRMHVPASERLSATLEIGKPAWKEYTLLDKALTVGLVVSIITAGSVLAYVLVTPRPGERFTEFYILGPGGKAEGYPTRLNVSEPGSVIIGVVNREFATVNYTVRVDLVGVEVRFNTTSGRNETVELNRTTWSWFNFTIGNGQNWTRLYTFGIGFAGVWKVQFLLFLNRDLTSVYQNLHLFVRVAAP